MPLSTPPFRAPRPRCWIRCGTTSSGGVATAWRPFSCPRCGRWGWTTPPGGRPRGRCAGWPSPRAPPSRRGWSALAGTTRGGPRPTRPRRPKTSSTDFCFRQRRRRPRGDPPARARAPRLFARSSSRRAGWCASGGSRRPRVPAPPPRPR
ncbi:unnamed protein product [Phytomonas sp. Hart1]|nr:unnamed protein product [Phytomonas sp. Hart1]|eukprot:CCW70972.1 unnamed protein product [Phytomonas sp. isolate Hart1]